MSFPAMREWVAEVNFSSSKHIVRLLHHHQHPSPLHPGSPDKDLDQKAAAKIAKYRELYRDHRRQLANINIDARPLPTYCREWP